MSEEAELRDGDSRNVAVLGRTALIRVTPQFAEGNLIAKLATQVSPELQQELRQKPEEELSAYFGGRAVTRYPNVVALMVHVLMRHYTSSVLGHIIPPTMGRTIILDRIRQVASTLLDEYRSYVDEVTRKIAEKKLAGKDFEDEVRNLIALQKLILIALSELANRWATLYTVNLPVRQRPPLANVKMGIEVIS